MVPTFTTIFKVFRNVLVGGETHLIPTMYPLQQKNTYYTVNESQVTTSCLVDETRLSVPIRLLPLLRWRRATHWWGMTVTYRRRWRRSGTWQRGSLAGSRRLDWRRRRTRSRYERCSRDPTEDHRHR